MEERKNLLLRFEFLRLIKRNKLDIREQSEADQIRNYMRKHEISQSTIFLSMCVFSFLNFRTLRSIMGTMRGIGYIYFLSIISSLPMNFYFSSIMMDKYSHLASQYYEEVLSASKSLQKYVNDNESAKSKQHTIEISPNRPTKVLNTVKVEDQGLDRNRNEGFYESHQENYDNFNYTEKDISATKAQGARPADERNDERFYGFQDQRDRLDKANADWNAGVQIEGSQDNVKPKQVRKIEFR